MRKLLLVLIPAFGLAVPSAAFARPISPSCSISPSVPPGFINEEVTGLSLTGYYRITLQSSNGNTETAVSANVAYGAIQFPTPGPAPYTSTVTHVNGKHTTLEATCNG